MSDWLNVSMDGISGTNQSKNAYWKRIHDYFHVHKKFTSDCSEGSLMNRWSAIRHDVNAFCGCVSKIEARNQSGCSVDDKVRYNSCPTFFVSLRTSASIVVFHYVFLQIASA